MIVLGVDPGLSLTGWGIVAAPNRNTLSMQCYGCIKTKPDQLLPARLKILHHTLQQVIQEYRPDVMAIEELFFSKEARTVAAVCQARGVILLAAAEAGVPVAEHNPRHVKMALTGYGSADKHQMQHMIKAVLRLKDIPKPDDSADALAIAVCQVNTQKW